MVGRGGHRQGLTRRGAHAGASPGFLILRVAVLAALRHVIVGLVMGLGGSFAVLALAEHVIVLSDRPAAIRAGIPVDRPYPRHRNDPELVRLRREILGILGRPI